MNIRYTLWHGRASNKIEVLNAAIESLRDNTWDTPLYINGAGWRRDDDTVRQDAAIRMLHCLGENESVSALNLQNITMNQLFHDAFSYAMIRNKHLRSLTLKNLSCEEGSPYSVPPAVFANLQLKSVVLSRVILNEHASQGLSRMIRESKSLESLTLEAVQIDKRGFLSLLSSLVQSSSISTLNLCNIEWSKDEIRRFLLVATHSRTITQLSMERMQLDARDAGHIAQLLRKNKTLDQLSLRNNDLDAEALEILVFQGLLLNQSLKKLCLSNNYLRNEGARHICMLLRESSSLQYLYLDHTAILDSGCMDIARALRFNHGLKFICMDGNSFETCAETLVKSLEHNMSLLHVLDCLPAKLARSHEHQESAGASSLPFFSWDMVDFYLRANKANRRFLREPRLKPQHIPQVWQQTNSQVDVLFHFIRYSSGSHYWVPSADSAKKIPEIVTLC